jgi:hypothetical protein
MRTVLKIAVYLTLVSAFAPSPAYAYIDPMSGSIIFQALAAGLLTAMLVLRRFWYRVTDVCRRVWHRIAH